MCYSASVSLFCFAYADQCLTLRFAMFYFALANFPKLPYQKTSAFIDFQKQRGSVLRGTENPRHEESLCVHAAQWCSYHCTWLSRLASMHSLLSSTRSLSRRCRASVAWAGLRLLGPDSAAWAGVRWSSSLQVGHQLGACTCSCNHVVGT